VAWSNGTNPASFTQYVVQLSTVSGFSSGTTLSSQTAVLSATFTSLSPNTIYYGQVKAWAAPTRQSRSCRRRCPSRVRPRIL
jgi:hypothetical protein